jgi:hypothetical protein
LVGERNNKNQLLSKSQNRSTSKPKEFKSNQLFINLT